MRDMSGGWESELRGGMADRNGSQFIGRRGQQAGSPFEESAGLERGNQMWKLRYVALRRLYDGNDDTLIHFPFGWVNLQVGKLYITRDK